MRPRSPLNDRQREVLRWIADGCPAGVMEGHSHKTTARALATRRLVKVSKRKGSWSAELTGDGRHYLNHNKFPVAKPSAKQPARSSPRPAMSDVVAPAGDVSSSPPERPARRPSRAEQLVADVVAAGGRLQRPAERDRWHGPADLVRTANRHGKTPAGTRLVHQVIYEGDRWSGQRFDLYTLVDGPAGTDAPLQPVPVPSEVTRYHKAVSALRKGGRLSLGYTAMARALRLLHAVAVEAERRGFEVSAHLPNNGTHGQTELWHLLLAGEGEIVPIKITEECDRVEHVATPKELKQQERHPWMRPPTHEHVPSGRLRIDIGAAAHSDRRSFWADRASWQLEDKLPELLREVAVRVDELRLLRAAQARAEEQHRQAVELETQRARHRAAEARRVEVLDQQLARWRTAQEFRAYAAAVSRRVAAAKTQGEADSEALAGARRWLEWIIERADRHDPLTRLPQWPSAPTLANYQLQQFMNRVPEPRDMRYRPETY